MEVIFGVQARDGALRIEIDDADEKAFRKQLETAFADDKLLWVKDKDGRTVGLPIDKIAFIEFPSEKTTARRVGFSA